MPSLNGLVLAGGRSRRLGQDKAGVMYRGTSLLNLSVARLREFCSPVLVAVGAGQADESLRARYEQLVDPETDAGPMSALAAAAQHDPDGSWLVTAVDMPFLRATSLRELVNQWQGARSETCDVFSLKAPGHRPEPLAAIYQPAALRVIDAAFRSGRRSPQRLILSLRWVGVEVDANELKSINAPADLTALDQRSSDYEQTE